MPTGWQHRDKNLAACAWAFPLAGLLCAALPAALYGGIPALPNPVGALLAVGLMIALTGGLHEDGLADCADGFYGGHTREHRLAIMKDSRIGAYGALALALSVGLRAGAVASLPQAWEAAAAIMAAAAASRAAIVVMMYLTPVAQAQGLAQQAGRPSAAVTLAALSLAVMIVLVLAGVKGALALLACALALGLARAAAMRYIGGTTGDVLGATQQLAEIAVLIALSLRFSEG